ncbi:MAG: Fe-S cluster biogenesis protein NfuA [Flavobacteriales bacterium]|jgi:Fe-S cluster biogenesis protein NfuA
MSKIPTTVYAEMTPNPSNMKFVANRLLVEGGLTLEFNTLAESKGKSPLAEELFQFPFVSGVFIASNFVTIAKTDAISWDLVNMQLREFVRTFLESGKECVTNADQIVAEKKAEAVKAFEELTPSEYDDKIKDLLEEYIRPAVEGDGGAIDFKSFNEGVVTVTLRGSCSGCPSSSATLKGGIETLLKQMIPAVTEVVAEEL